MEKANSKANLAGVYELDAAGIILYSSIKPSDGTITRAYNLDGQDFFSCVTQFRNAGDLQDLFDRFQAAGSTTENFNFTCKYDSEDHNIRVLIARLTKTEPDSFLIYIRA